MLACINKGVSLMNCLTAVLITVGFTSLCVLFPEFTFQYIQREGLRDPIIFEKADDLGIE